MLAHGTVIRKDEEDVLTLEKDSDTGQLWPILLLALLGEAPRSRAPRRGRGQVC